MVAFRRLYWACAVVATVTGSAADALTVQNSADLSRTLAGNRFSGVGTLGSTRIAADGSVRAQPNCTGTLVSANVVLTAAHCLNNSQFILPASGDFNVAGGGDVYNVKSSYVFPSFYDASKGTDLAVVTLDRNVYGRTIYGLYDKTDEIGQVATLVGAGAMGTMDTGVNFSISDYRLRSGLNRIDGTYADFIRGIYLNLYDTDFRPADEDDRYIYDYDNGTAENDTFGRYIGVQDRGVYRDGVLEEVGVIYGDSGGPDFLNGLVSGVHSGVASAAYFETRDATGCGTNGSADFARPGRFVNSCFDGSWGDFGVTFRVSYYANPIRAYITSAAVPEPATWAMMVGGFGAIGGAMRRRKISSRALSAS